MTGAVTARVEFFFDCSSPWTYLAFERMRRLSEARAEAITWRPILAGGVFNAVNPELYARRAAISPARAAHSAKDMADWARLYGIAVHFPPACGHPVNSVKCMRACTVLDSAPRLAFAEQAFRALWRDGRDLADDGVLRDIATAAGIDGDWLADAITRPAAKAGLRAATDELIARGGFGSPTIFVDRDDMYFGNDRIVLVEAALDKPARTPVDRRGDH
ncbi:2-hydroxychromene-2-carboxylate isomerase [Sphingomonas sp.]|uniref:2-hydroxychromene-2-carboxylate isomerase n=1 Tax=Sphingomonas sp. TaxID=28214 RepID=UPI002DD62FE2|nr:2-hydroxychromene-2-carboxylate isomerase [Sphingomonas sp.]